MHKKPSVKNPSDAEHYINHVRVNVNSHLDKCIRLLDSFNVIPKEDYEACEWDYRSVLRWLIKVNTMVEKQSEGYDDMAGCSSDD